jgi:hypothetical protein
MREYLRRQALISSACSGYRVVLDIDFPPRYIRSMVAVLGWSGPLSSDKNTDSNLPTHTEL